MGYPAERASRTYERRPAYKVRSKPVTLSVTPGNFDFLDAAARRHGRSMARLLGDVIEALIERGEFDDVLERKRR